MKNISLSSLVVFWILSGLFLSDAVPAARAAVISGKVVDAYTGSPIQNAEVRLLPGDTVTVTDIRGQFLFTNVTGGRYGLRVACPGYENSELEKIDIRREDPGSRSYKIPLKPYTYKTEINVTAEPMEIRFKEIMKTEIPAELLENEPGALEDPVKKVQTLPGVVGESDFLSLLYIRGGGADETMLFLDRSYLLNPYHLGGVFTVYFEDLVDTVEFYTGGFPAKYGNALSGILDIRYRSGDRLNHHGYTDLSPISAKFSFEGPLVKGRTSYLIAGRRSYWELAMKLYEDEGEDLAAPYFGDLFGKVTYFGDTRWIAFELLYGQDGIERFELDEPLENPDADPGTFFFINKNRMANITWDEWIGPKWSMVGTFAYSQSETTADLTGTEPLNADASIDFFMGDLQMAYEGEVSRVAGGVQAGWASLTLDSFLTDFRTAIDGSRKTGNQNLDKTDIDFTKPFRFQGLWSEYEVAPNWDRDFQLTLGLRADRWDPTDEYMLAPRLNVMVGLTPRFRLKAATGVFYQFPYNVLKTAPGFGNPDLRSERAVHYILGAEGDISQFFRVRVEGFYKVYDRSIVNHDTAEAAAEAIQKGQPFVNEGEGFAYGGELFCQLFPWRMFDGWFTYGYTLTRLRNPLHRTNPEWYYPLQDQRHTLHLVANVHPFRRWTLSGRLTYGSGRPETPITGWGLELDKDPPHLPIWVAEYGSLNSARLESYFRLDLRVMYAREFPKGDLAIHLDLMNATNRKNVYVQSYDSGDPPDTSPDQETIYNLPILPVLGVSYRF